MEDINIDLISLSNTNPRKYFNEKAMEELTENIRKLGVLQPIIVRNIADGYELVAGERRLRAAKAAGLTEIPAMVHDMTDQEALEVQVIENLHRADLHPMEEAEGYERLMREGGYKAQDLAVKVGKSPAYIYGRMKLCGLSQKVRESFFKDDITASIALLIARIPDQELQDAALSTILGETDFEPAMTYKDAVSYIRAAYMRRLKGASFNTKDADLVPAAGSCADCLKRTGNQKELFPDVGKDDLCTDPKCYQEKVKAGSAKKILEAQDQGITVLTGKEAKKALFCSSGYIDLDSTCWQDPDNRTYRQLLGKHNLTKTLALGSDSIELHELYPEKEVDSLLEEKYDWAKPALPVNPVDLDAEERKRKQILLEVELLRDAVLKAAVKAPKDPEFWKMLARMAVNNFHANVSGVAFRRGLTDDAYEDGRDELQAVILKMQSIEELHILLFELWYDDDFRDDCVKLFGIDKKPIKAAARAKLKEQEGKSTKVLEED